MFFQTSRKDRRAVTPSSPPLTHLSMHGLHVGALRMQAQDPSLSAPPILPLSMKAISENTNVTRGFGGGHKWLSDLGSCWVARYREGTLVTRACWPNRSRETVWPLALGRLQETPCSSHLVLLLAGTKGNPPQGHRQASLRHSSTFCPFLRLQQEHV